MISALADYLSANPERFFSYISVRSACSLSVAFLFCVLLGPRFIEAIRRAKVGQHIRKSTGEGAVDLSEMHAGKSGTPTMGGILMLGAIVVATALFADWSQPVVWLAMAMGLGFAALGFVDDYRKFKGGKSEGLKVWEKFGGQILLGGAFGLLFVYGFGDVVQYTYAGNAGADMISLPFIKSAFFSLGILYVPFAILVLSASSNAVNLTDGLDGLAAGVSAVTALCLAVVAYLVGRADAATYLVIPHVSGGGELTVILSALVGASFGFLWFNSHPAQIFMGDTGSMMIGGFLGAAALLLKQEFLLVIVGGIFVAEAASVILQVASFKLSGRRIFRMSPLHHHFERGGMPESKIIVRFWLVSALLALAGLSTLKLR